MCYFCYLVCHKGKKNKKGEKKVTPNLKINPDPSAQNTVILFIFFFPIPSTNLKDELVVFKETCCFIKMSENNIMHT